MRFQLNHVYFLSDARPRMSIFFLLGMSPTLPAFTDGKIPCIYCTRNEIHDFHVVSQVDVRRDWVAE